MTRVKSMKRLEEKRDSIKREIEMLQSNLRLVEDLLQEEKGGPAIKMRAPRSNVKQAVIDLLTKAGAAGINASQAVAMAAKDGVALDRGSVSSLLSRMKNEGTVEYDGSVYRLVAGPDKAATVHPFRTSGAGM